MQVNSLEQDPNKIKLLSINPTIYDTSVHPDLIINQLNIDKLNSNETEISFINNLAEKLNIKSVEPDIALKKITKYLRNSLTHQSSKDVMDQNGSLSFSLNKPNTKSSFYEKLLELEMNINPSFFSAFSDFDIEKELIRTNHFLFPNYTLRPINYLLRTNDKRPRTNCLEEAIIASILASKSSINKEDIFIIGSPVHYTTFLDLNEPIWFERKSNKLTHEQIKKFDVEGYNKTIGTDRVIGFDGYLLIDSKKSSFSSERQERIKHILKKYFKKEVDLTGIEQVSNFSYDVESDRIITPTNMFHFLFAAIKDNKSKELSEKYSNPESIKKFLDKLDNEPVIDPSRVGMPTEVIYDQSGNSLEKSLLFLSMMHHSNKVDFKKLKIDILGTNDKCNIYIKNTKYAF